MTPPRDAPAGRVTAAEAAESLWRDAGLPAPALQRLMLEGGEPAVPSSFAVGTALQASLGVAALAAVELGRLRGGPAQQASVDIADVVRECAGRFTVDGRKPQVWDKLSGLYRCDAGRGWVRLHANFEHHRDGALRLLGLPPGAQTERAAVEQALASWRAEDFESAAAAQGLVAAAVRPPAQWLAHPQSAAVAAQPLVELRRIGDAPPLPLRRLPPSARPLHGLRVLDLTRILAGPVAGRTLAAYGADVLLVNGPHLPNIDAIADTSRGKRSAHVDLRTPAGVDRLWRLAEEADVFLGAYRPGALDARGFDAHALAQRRPGIVCVTLSAYGHAGPWAGRRGFDSLVQSTTGMNVDEAGAFGSDTPRALPLQALDYGAAYLLAFGAVAALSRQRREGGSWQVRVSLAGVGRWLRSLGRLPDGPLAAWPSFDGAMETSETGFGRLSAVRHAVRLSATPARWERPSMPPGSHAAAWEA